MYDLITTSDEFMSMVQTLELYIKQPGVRLALDLETYGPNKKQVPRPTRNKDGTYNGYVRTIQIGLDPINPKLAIRNKQYIIDATKIPADMITTYLKPILEKTRILGQNLKYEWQFLFVHYGINIRQLVDTMLFSQVLYAGDKINHGLGDLYGRYLDMGWFTTETGMTFEEYKRFKEALQTMDWEGEEFSPEQLRYAADDVKFVFYVLEALFEESDRWIATFERGFGKERGIIPVLQLEFSLIPVFGMMELRGIKIDTEYHRNTVIQYLEQKRDEAARMVGFTRTITKKMSNGKRGKLRVTWEEQVEEPLNLRSWQQLKPKINQLLRDHLSPDIEIDSTAEDDIRAIVLRYAEYDPDEPDRPVLPLEIKEKLLWILQYKKASSLLSKFGPKMLELSSDRGYLHPSWFQIGTDELAVSSGRSSCKNPNMMQIPSRGVLWVQRYDEKSRPLLFGSTGDFADGINVLQFFRRSYIAEDEWTFIDADYSQEEPRLAAEYCGQQDLIDAYVQHGKKTDIHGIVAMALMGLKEQPKKGDFNRDYIGKTAGLSLIYGISYKSLKDFMYTKTEGKVKWTEKDAKDSYDRFFSRFPAIRRKMAEVDQRVRQLAEAHQFTLAPFKKGRRPFAVAYTLMGRARRFCLRSDQMRMADHELHRDYIAVKFDPKTKKPMVDEEGNVVTTKWNTYRERLSSASRESFNHGIQGTAADILKYAILDIHYEFLEAGFGWDEGIVAVIHDEVLIHVRKENAKKASEIVERCMKRAFTRFVKRVPCDVDIHEAVDWAAAKAD